MSHAVEEQSKRPRPVSIVAILQMLQGLAFIGLGLYPIYQQNWPNLINLFGSEMFWKNPALAGLGLAFSGLLASVFAVGLLRMQAWGWLFSLSLQGLILLWALISYGLGRPNYAVMALGVVLVFYLNHQEVQSAFRSTRAI